MRRVNNVSQITPSQIFLKENHKKQRFQLDLFGDVPALSGLGSSSAFTVSLLNLFREYNKKMSK